MSNARIEADKLRHEAKQHLNALLKTTEDSTVDRFVDCVIFAAVLEVAALQAEAIAKSTRGDNAA